MARKKEDYSFEIGFYESVLRREPDYADVVELLGGLYTKAGRVADGLDMDNRLVRMRPASALARYNLACSLALAGRKAEALEALARAIALGYDDAAWLAKDADLACLKDEPAFLALLAKLGQESRQQSGGK